MEGCVGSTAALQNASPKHSAAPAATLPLGEIDENALSRQLAVFGHGGQAKIKDAHVLVSGLGAVGMEVAKNVALSGVKAVTVHDTAQVDWTDVNGNFYLCPDDLGANRAERSYVRLEKLNPTVSVACKTCCTQELDLAGVTVLVLCEASLEDQIEMNARCRQAKVRMVVADVRGVFGWVFADMGEDFVTSDKDGEALKECMISDISCCNPGVVQTIGSLDAASGKMVYKRHGLEDGDLVELRDLPDPHKPLADAGPFTVTVVDPFSFSIGEDTSGLPAYCGGATYVQVKKQYTMSFKPLKESLETPEFMDPPDLFKEFCQWPQQGMLLAVRALHQFTAKYARLPAAWSQHDAQLLEKLAVEIYNHSPGFQVQGAETHKFEIKEPSQYQAWLRAVRLLSMTAAGYLPPLATAIGAFASQEALKAIMGKYSPLKQWLAIRAEEVVPASMVELCDGEVHPDHEQLVAEFLGPARAQRTNAQVVCLGRRVCDRLEELRVFMVGSGAIGCELLKNLAMLNCCVAGELTVSDPDQIEKSNLNRQFLFCHDDIGHFKSHCAAKAVAKMVPEMQVIWATDKICPDTEDKYSDSFIGGLDVTLNALDNVKAREYVDQRCVALGKPLIDSGTTGTKGHVQVMLPHLTETWGDSNDPQDTEEFPVCTVKLFPSEIAHTIHWAKETFEMRFCSLAREVNKLVGGTDSETRVKIESSKDPNMLKTLQAIDKLLKTRPHTFADCVRVARGKFDKWFYHRINKLLKAHPADELETYKNSEGELCKKLFWSLPRRCPRPTEFDPSEKQHMDFVEAFAMLHAKFWQLEDAQMHAESRREMVAEIATGIQVSAGPEDAGELDAEDAKKYQDGVSAADLQKDQEAKFDPSQFDEIADRVCQQLQDARAAGFGLSLFEEEFEKDDDSNFHVGFITAASNLRATGYGIPAESFFRTKLLAGKIIPAIATTTSIVSALVCIEMIKVVGGAPKDAFKNANVNLALPMVSLYEPYNPISKKLLNAADNTPLPDSEVSFNAWDVWELKLGREMKLQQLVDHFKNKYGLLAWSVFYNGVQVVDGAGRLMDPTCTGAALKAATAELEPLLCSSMVELIESACGISVDGTSLDLNISFHAVCGDQKVTVKEAPKVRLGLSDADAMVGLLEQCEQLQAQLQHLAKHGATTRTLEGCGLRLEVSPATPEGAALLGFVYESGLQASVEIELREGPTALHDGDVSFGNFLTILQHLANLSGAKSWYPGPGTVERAQCDDALWWAGGAVLPVLAPLLESSPCSPGQGSYMVSGAGAEQANGTYVRCDEGLMDGVAYYKNSANTLIMIRYAMKSGSKYWYITESTKIDLPEGDYYRIRSSAESPPFGKNAWTTAGCPDGIEPAPLITQVAAVIEEPEPPVMDQQTLDALEQTLLPHLKQMLDTRGNGLILGEKPCLADLAIGVPLALCCLRYKTSPIWTTSLVQYCRRLRRRLPRWDEYMNTAEVEYGGFNLSAQRYSDTAPIWLPKNATVSQLRDAVASTFEVSESSLHLKIGSEDRCFEVAAGAPDGLLRELGLRNRDGVRVMTVGSLEMEGDGPVLARAMSHQEEEPALNRTYTQHMMDQVSQIVKIDMDKAGHVFYPYRDDEPRNDARIEQDISYLVTGLPKTGLSGGAMFIARDLHRQHYIKAMLVGPADTPYEAGCFEFDICLPPEYPDSPPKVQLVTTGRGAVRFNANMYSNGKVCLSLLGTHSNGAPWDRENSTILQVIESIAWCIMIGNEVPGKPWFNEPGFADDYEYSGELSPLAEALSACYDREIRRCNIKICMIDMIRKPPLGFELAVREHFSKKGDQILELVRKWEEEELGSEESLIVQLQDEANHATTSEEMEQVLERVRAHLASESNPHLAEIGKLRTKLEERITEAKLVEAKADRAELDNLKARVARLREICDKYSVDSSIAFDELERAASNTEEEHNLPASDKQRWMQDKEQALKALRRRLYMFPTCVLEAVVDQVPSFADVEALVELVTSDDFDADAWLGKQKDQDELKALPASLVVEEWKMADGTLVPLEQWSINTSNHNLGGQSVLRRVTQQEILDRMRSNWSPLEDAIGSVKQLLQVMAAPAVRWEYAYYNSDYWEPFDESTSAEIEAAKLFGRSRLKVATKSHGQWYADLDQLKMNKLQPGMGHQSGEEQWLSLIHI
eukprot:TRINITY_DN8170_c0_g3_i8.p1 TRINITY_DN8170_c0_g3~~TRINITY_DN8170_c0_g3_i8.p1  ORF type:complete len:2166 (-),score=571.50 TRINITY_DN8170_c0_g3_i8:147-6644(-)